MFCINNTLGLQSEASKINVKIVSIRKYYISVGFLVLSSFFWKQMQNKIKKNPQNVLVYFYHYCHYIRLSLETLNFLFKLVHPSHFCAIA